ncbi:hypothetical protein [Streptomyces sp. NPDC017991]|uniref:hypothetical protein n=1 Tax=Streptomyces sp. NPDC017991 TaxID=3365026 RepID=UPI00379BABB1
MGESRRAWHWFHQLIHSMADTTPPDAAFLEGLELFARYVRTNGSRALAPARKTRSTASPHAHPAAPSSSSGLTGSWWPACGSSARAADRSQT